MRAAPLSIVCVSKERSSAVAVCAAESEFVQRTRPPFLTVIVTGAYLNDWMSTVADAAGGESPEAGLEPPHPLAKAAAASSTKARRKRTHLLRRPRASGSARSGGLLRPQPQLLLGRQPLLQLALALQLRVELGAEQQRQVREPHPDEERDHAPERPVRLPVGAEVAHVQ